MYTDISDFTCIWPRVLLTGELPENWSKASLCADGLMGWGLCMSGNNPPDKFGWGMAKIGEVLGIPATSENLIEYSKQILNN